jgi:hypothetical protein
MRNRPGFRRACLWPSASPTRPADGALGRPRCDRMREPFAFKRQCQICQAILIIWRTMMER